MQWWIDFVHAILLIIAGAGCAFLEWRYKHIEGWGWISHPIFLWLGILAIVLGSYVVVKLLFF